MGGTIAATCNVLATMFSSGPVDSAFSFFLSAIVVLVIATMGYILLPFTVSVAFIRRSRFIILCEFCAINLVSIIGMAVCALSCLRSPPQALPLLPRVTFYFVFSTCIGKSKLISHVVCLRKAYVVSAGSNSASN